MGLLDFFKNISNIQTPDSTKDSIAESMKLFPNIGYQFDCIKTYKRSKSSDVCYLIEGKNKEKAMADLEKVNKIIKEHSKEDKNYSKFSIDVATARFSSPDMKNGSDDFCCLYCNPLTPSGRPSKFPLKMRINPLSADEMSRRSMSKSGKTVHGWIYYLADGSIGKAEIYCWQGDTGYFIEDNYTIKK